MTTQNYDTEAMAKALHEEMVYREGGTPNWPALSPERKADYVSRAGALIQRYLVRSEQSTPYGTVTATLPTNGNTAGCASLPGTVTVVETAGWAGPPNGVEQGDPK